MPYCSTCKKNKLDVEFYWRELSTPRKDGTIFTRKALSRSMCKECTCKKERGKLRANSKTFLPGESFDDFMEYVRFNFIDQLTDEFGQINKKFKFVILSEKIEVNKTIPELMAKNNIFK